MSRVYEQPRVPNGHIPVPGGDRKPKKQPVWVSIAFRSGVDGNDEFDGVVSVVGTLEEALVSADRHLLDHLDERIWTFETFVGDVAPTDPTVREGVNYWTYALAGRHVHQRFEGDLWQADELCDGTRLRVGLS